MPMNINEIRNWADIVGTIDPGIKELVVYLNALGITTSMSCEGHYDGSGLPAPWVSYQANIPWVTEAWQEVPNWRHDTKRYNKLANRGKYLRRKLKAYLDSFYANKERSSETHLIVRSEYYGYRLVNAKYEEFVSAFMEGRLVASEALREKTLTYRSEFDAFLVFLTQEYSATMRAK
jgi:hypothetical protein